MQRNFKEPIKLNLGCGRSPYPGYINCDIVYRPGVDLVTDIRYLRDFEQNSVSVIVAIACLEHFSRWHYKEPIKRWYELLQNDGILRLSVPDWDALVDHYNENKDLRILTGMLFGGQDEPFQLNQHHICFNWDILSSDLYEIGFKKVEKYDWRATDHSQIDDYSQSYLPHLDKTKGKLMHLNIEATK